MDKINKINNKIKFDYKKTLEEKGSYYVGKYSKGDNPRIWYFFDELKTYNKEDNSVTVGPTQYHLIIDGIDVTGESGCNGFHIYNKDLFQYYTNEWDYLIYKGKEIIKSKRQEHIISLECFDKEGKIFRYLDEKGVVHLIVHGEDYLEKFKNLTKGHIVKDFYFYDENRWSFRDENSLTHLIHEGKELLIGYHVVSNSLTDYFKYDKCYE